MKALGLVVPSIVVAALGCGDDSSATKPDAAVTADAAIDSGPQCGGAGPVTVIGPAYDPARVQLTLAVVSHDANGTMCAMKDGGSGPEAQMMIDVPPSGMVTMVIDDGDSYHGLFTWTEVQPGDQLLFPSPDPRGVTAKTVPVEVTIPALSGVTSYDVYFQCEHGGGGLSDPAPPGVFTKDVECRSDATAMAAMVAAENGSSTQYAVSAVTPIAATGTTTLTLGAWAAAAEPTVTMHGTAGFDRAYVGYAPGATADFFSVSMLAFADVTADPVTIGPRAVPATWGTHMAVGIGQSAEPTHSLQIGRDQATPMSMDVTVTTDFLPLVSAQLVEGLPRPSITWSTARPASADAVYINAGTWLMMAHAQPGTVRFPEVPSALLPTGPATVQAINFIDAKSVTSFDSVRRDPIAPYNDREYSLSSVGDTFGGLVP